MQKRHFMMKNFIGFLLVIILMSSCSEYQKLLKSGDSQTMYKKAVEYYNNGDYTKASNLFDGIRMVFQGTSKAQSVAYYRAFCSYNQKDYEVAAELFKQFVSIYPESSYVEECLYMIGYCNFLASPKARLDQTVTEKVFNFIWAVTRTVLVKNKFMTTWMRWGTSCLTKITWAQEITIWEKNINQPWWVLRIV